MKLSWSAFALSDREGIFTHIEADNPIAAITIDERIVAAVRLQDFPESGRLGRIAATRELVFRYPLYRRLRSNGDGSAILRVLHGAQQWPDALSKD